MQLNLFDYQAESTARLMTSLANAEITNPTVIIHPNGNIDKGVYNPFFYYLGLTNTGRGCYFNEVEVPLYYEIRHKTYQTAEILDGVRVAAVIHYYPDTQRMVQRVVWRDSAGEDVYTDYYTKYGEFYARGLFDEDKKENRVQFYDASGKLTIVWHRLQGHVTLYTAYGNEYFENLTQFAAYFIRGLVTSGELTDLEHLLINNLSFPLFTARDLNLPTTLYWQETITKDIPGNMKYQLETTSVFTDIVFEDRKQLELVQKAYPTTHVKLRYLAPLYKFTRDHQFNGRALIMTKSDVLYKIDELIAAVPNLPITIAAPTNMSDKLLGLGEKYPQVRLLPNVSKVKTKELLKTHDLYLNINAGAEVDHTLASAYMNNMIILSVAKYSKNALFEWNFAEEDFQVLLNTLIRLRSSKVIEEKILREFHGQLEMATKVDYQETFSN